jgi:hypothetical protein
VDTRAEQPTELSDLDLELVSAGGELFGSIADKIIEFFRRKDDDENDEDDKRGGGSGKRRRSLGATPRGTDTFDPPKRIRPLNLPSIGSLPAVRSMGS